MSTRRDDTVLLLLFGALYFVQGVVEPTACLPSQPLQSHLRDAGVGLDDVGRFFGVIGLAWSFKPLYGLMTDFVPLFGTHRRSYLVLSTSVFGLGFLGLASFGRDDIGVHEALLTGIGIAIATTDVVIDATAVEHGQARGLTGTIQAVQWGSNSFAAVLAGVAGGWLAERNGLGAAYVLCGALGIASLVLVLVTLREPRQRERPTDNLRTAFSELRVGSRAAILGAVAVFQLLWNFNPFTYNVLQLYATEVLQLSEQFYGFVVSARSVAELLACVVYAVVCRRIPFGTLIHLSIALQIGATAIYVGMVGPMSALIVNFAFGLGYQFAVLVTMDLAMRACPRASAGTTFALLMAVANFGGTLSVYVGGSGYETLLARLGSPMLAFDALVLVGAATTALCWAIVPVMRRAGVAWS